MIWKQLNDDEQDYLAIRFREALGYGPDDRINGAEALARFMNAYPWFKLELVEDQSLPLSEAEAYPALKMVKARKSLHNSLQLGDERATLIFIEEMWHVLRGHDNVLHRTVGNDNFAKANSRKMAQEREAKSLAAKTIAPTESASRLDDAASIAKTFGLSHTAAGIRFNETDRLRRKRLGKIREIPERTLDAMRLLQIETGFKLPVVASIGSRVSRARPDRQYVSHPEAQFIAEKCPSCGHRMQQESGGCRTCINCGDSDCN